MCVSCVWSRVIMCARASLCIFIYTYVCSRRAMVPSCRVCGVLVLVLFGAVWCGAVLCFAVRRGACERLAPSWPLRWPREGRKTQHEALVIAVWGYCANV